MIDNTDIAIIGAGPSGAIAAALLRQRGHRVTVVEQATFPRFSIGESLLPQCMVYIAEAGMANAVEAAGFQYKNGAAFVRNGQRTAFDFRDKFSSGPGTTFQVQRATFDNLLAIEAAQAGAEIRFGHRIDSYCLDAEGQPVLGVTDAEGQSYRLRSRFVLDGSGFGRVLPRLLGLESPSSQPPRMSVYTHIEDRISDSGHDRDKILIAVHPRRHDIWYWLIPFTGGRCSLGAVADPGWFRGDEAPEQALKRTVAECPELATLLANASFDTVVNSIRGYSCNVSSLWGEHYALLGNAGEFLDPVFSSGVTIAMKSASLAAPLVDRQLAGAAVDWETEYAQPLKLGVETFRTYVDAWYDGSFQEVIFCDRHQPEVRAMIASILAGYAWDTANPFVREPGRRLKSLVALCT